MFCFLDAESCVLRCPSSPRTPISHKGRKGSLGILMPKTREGTQGLPKDPGRGWGLGRARPPQPRAARSRVGARHAAPVQRSAAAGHCCNPAPQAKRVSPRRGAASCARPLLCRSGALLQSCTAGEAGLPSAGRGMPRPYSAQRQRGIAAILRRRRSGSLRGGARHAAPVLCSAAAGHRCNPAPQRPRGAPAPAARSAESCSMCSGRFDDDRRRCAGLWPAQ